MSLLMTTNPEHGGDALHEVRERARDLYSRSSARRGPGGVHGVIPPMPATRAELDELWALVPGDRLSWARRHVALLVETARKRDATAMPRPVLGKDLERLLAHVARGNPGDRQ